MATAKKTLGNFGEQLAHNFLANRGYEILFQNRKIGRWEIDLIARLKNQIIFVEVKTLANARMIPAEQALTRRQIEILTKAIRLYCWRNKINPANSRLDFISINLDRLTKIARLRHYQNII